MDDGYIDYLLSEDTDTGEDGMDEMGEVALTLSSTRDGNQTRRLPYATGRTTADTQYRTMLAELMAVS